MSDIIPNVVVSMPSQLFTLARKFQAASNGKIYIGKIDTDPTIPENQIQVYLENEDGSTIPVAQPLIINQAGYPVYNGQIAKFVTVEGHSMAVYDSYGARQFYYDNVLKYDPDQFSQAVKNGDGSLIGIGNGTLKDAIKFVTPEMYGAVPWEFDDIKSTDFVDSYQNLQDMFDSGHPVSLTKKYVTSKPILISENTKITGSGSKTCGIFKSTNTTSGLGNFSSPTGVGSISYDVDAVLIIKKANQGYASNLDLSGFRVSKCGTEYKDDNHEYEGIGIFAPYMSESTWKDIVSFGFKTPIYNINSWMNNFIRVHMHGHDGFSLGGKEGDPDNGGTTTTLSNCWSTATGADKYAWTFNRIWQVQLIGCASEYVGDAVSPATGVIRAEFSHLVINGMDLEKAHVKKLIYARGSYIDLSGINTYQCYAKYADSSTYLLDVYYSRVSINNGGISFNRDDLNLAVNSNFAKVQGENAYLNIQGSIIVPENIKVVTGAYTPSANDFVVYTTEKGTADFLSIPQGAPDTQSRVITTPLDLRTPFKSINYEEYTDTNRLRGLNYSTVFVGASAANKGTSGDAYILNFTNGNSNLTQNNSYQIEFNTAATQVKFRGALWGMNNYTTWREFYTTANTTKDSNGNLKAASPIIKLFADKIECNEESEGVEMEYLGIGHYLIKGVVGFNADGAWGINNGFVIPQDHNGKNMVLIDYEVRPDGDIEVFVFHQQNADMPERFQNKRIKYFDEEGAPVYFENYEPCDVPESRWIDMRVEMPPNSIYNQKLAEAEQLAKIEAERVAKEEAEKSE